MTNCVVIVGSGMMGSGIAAKSALAGRPTILVDMRQDLVDAGVEKAKEWIGVLLENGLAESEEAERAKARVWGNCDLSKALKEAGMVIEAVSENLTLKQKLFVQIDELLPADIPISSNTSGLRITDIASGVRYPQRTMTTHFWFPAYLVPLVEVVMWEKTDLQMAEQMKQELKRWGKEPVLVKKDLPGQLANRILQAVIREASSIVQMGLASPEDVDTAVKMGMGIRFPAWGPLEHVDGVGVDLCTSVQNTVLPNISRETKACGLMEQMVSQGRLGVKTGSGFYDWEKKDFGVLTRERDQFIIEVLKILKAVKP